MAEIIQFPLSARVDRWARWEQALAREYFLLNPQAGDACEIQAHLVVRAWRNAPKVALFEGTEAKCLLSVGFKTPPPGHLNEQEFREAIVAWLNMKE